MYMTIVLVISCFVAGGRASCPEVTVKQDFELSQYAGTWYQQAQFNSPINHAINKCVKATYTYNEANENYDVTTDLSVQLFKGLYTKKQSLTGTMELSEPSKKEGKVNLALELPFIGKNTGCDCILGTDYEHWAVVYSCKDVLGMTTKGAWIMTRKQKLSEYTEEQLTSMDEEVNAILEAAGLDRTKFVTTEQNDC